MAINFGGKKGKRVDMPKGVRKYLKRLARKRARLRKTPHKVTNVGDLYTYDRYW